MQRVKVFAVRCLGVVALFVAAFPAIAGGVYAIAAQDEPRNVAVYLGLTDLRLLRFAPRMGYTWLGIFYVVMGVCCLSTAAVLIIRPEKCAAEAKATWRRIACRIRAFIGRGHRSDGGDEGE